MKATVTTLEAKKAGEIELADAIYGLEPRSDILHRMVRYQQLKRMAGTHHAQDRSEVTVTGKKVYKQKGTGGARHGDKSVPQWRGGGKAFGPKPRDHAIEMPKKVRALALRHALSAKAQAGEVVVLDKAESKDGKTSALRDQFAKLEWTNVLIIDGSELQADFVRAARNLPNIDVLPIQGLNVYVSEKLSNLGQGVFTVQRFGLITNRQEFLEAVRKNRKLLPADGRAIAQHCDSAIAVAWETHASVDLRRNGEEIRDVDIGGVTAKILEIEPYEIADGRLIAEHEDSSAAPVAVFAVAADGEAATADELLAAHGADIAQLLRGERELLSTQEREEALRHRLSYLAGDLVVVTWSAAFIYDTEANVLATQDILEFANSQLLQFRYYDRLLDDELTRIYAHLQQPH